MKVIVKLQIVHGNSFVAFNVILVLYKKLYVYTCFFNFFLTIGFFSWRVWWLLFLVNHVAFSLFYQGKCCFFQCTASLDIHLVKVFLFCFVTTHLNEKNSSSTMYPRRIFLWQGIFHQRYLASRCLRKTAKLFRITFI